MLSLTGAVPILIVLMIGPKDCETSGHARYLAGRLGLPHLSAHDLTESRLGRRDLKRGFVLDGSAEDTGFLDRQLASAQRHPQDATVVVHFDAPCDEACHRRISGLLENYRANDYTIHRIDPTRPAEEVSARLLRLVDPRRVLRQRIA